MSSRSATTTFILTSVALLYGVLSWLSRVHDPQTALLSALHLQSLPSAPRQIVLLHSFAQCEPVGSLITSLEATAKAEQREAVLVMFHADPEEVAEVRARLDGRVRVMVAGAPQGTLSHRFPASGFPAVVRLQAESRPLFSKAGFPASRMELSGVTGHD